MCETQQYDELFEKYKKLQMEVEMVNQALYDCQRAAKAAGSLQNEYEEEIKMLKTEATEGRQRHEARLQQLEEQQSTLKASHTEQINSLESELMSKEDEITQLKKEMADIMKITESHEPLVDDKLFEEISDLRQHNLELTERVTELEKSLEASEKRNVALQEAIKHLENELENYKESLECKREELEEANSLMQTLKDDFLCVKSELDMIRSQPLDDQSKGNSLFAEVDDRRLQLQQNMNMMKTKYLEMKRERASYLKQIATLRNENATLIAQREAEIDGKRRDEETIISTYKDQIQILNELIDSYQKQLKEKSNSDASVQGMKFFDNMLAMKNAELEELRQKLSTRALNHTSLSYDLAEANRQIRKYNLEILQQKNEIGKLKTKIQEMELVSPTEKSPPEIKMPKSIVKNSNDADLNKENDLTNKKVQFTEATTEPQITERSKFRKGAKVLISKPIKYS